MFGSYVLLWVSSGVESVFLRSLPLPLGRRLIGWVATPSRQESRRVLEARTIRMAGERLVDLYARLDLPTLQSEDTKEKLTQLSYPVLGGGMFTNLSEVINDLLPIWSTLLQFLLIFLHFARTPQGPTLIVICLSSFLTLSYLYANYYGPSECRAG